MFMLLLQNIFLCLQVNESTSGSFKKPLSPEEERHTLDRYENGTDEERAVARAELIERNLRLVAHIVKKYNTPGNKIHDADELISIGTIGLIKGIKTFKIEKGTKLATYVSKCIENAILTKRGVLAHMMSNMHLLRKNGTSLTALVANFT